MGIIKRRNLLRIAVPVLATCLALLAGATGPSSALAGGRADCWMTGGGSIFDVAYGGRVTHGFVVHCTPRNSDNLEVNDHVTGQSFHLDQLTSTTCIDDPAIDPNPPDATFDTFTGTGTGRCHGPGESGPGRDCTVRFTFTDGGERGGCVRDTALIEVSDANGVVFSVSGDVDCGNHQAHSQ